MAQITGRPPIYGKSMVQISGIFLTDEQIKWLKKIEIEKGLKRGEYLRLLIDKEMGNRGDCSAVKNDV